MRHGGDLITMGALLIEITLGLGGLRVTRRLHPSSCFLSIGEGDCEGDVTAVIYDTCNGILVYVDTAWS